MCLTIKPACHGTRFTAESIEIKTALKCYIKQMTEVAMNFERKIAEAHCSVNCIPTHEIVTETLPEKNGSRTG